MATVRNLPCSDRWREALEGARTSLPILPAIAPFAAIFGALAIEAGLSPGQTLMASATIFAGASQYAMLELLGQGVPAWSVLFTVFAINARHLLYSAALGRRLTGFSTGQRLLAFFLLVDPQYAVSEQRAMSPSGLRPAFYFGYGVCLYGVWMLGNALGIAFGGLIQEPARFGLDFILPIYFLSLIVGFRRADRFVMIAVVSAVVSLLVWQLVGSPWHITGGGLAGLLAAAILSKPPLDDGIAGTGGVGASQ